MSLPLGTITFLFTDIEGSTRLWEQFPETMRPALARHDALLQAAVKKQNGVVVKTTGDGILAAFATAPDALQAALTAQQILLTESWPAETPLRVRIALHTGVAEARDGDYYGQPLNRAARLRDAAHGGQCLLSQSVYELTRDAPPSGVTFLELGEHRLRDLSHPERIYQILHSDLPSAFPPLRSLNNAAFPNNLPLVMTSFIGREREIKVILELLTRRRLVTLMGSGGCGKTRLSLQVAADALERFPDGVWFIELAPLTDPELVPQQVADALNISKDPNQTVAETLCDALKAKNLLLVLDNCEHLLSPAARLADSLLRVCPDVRILASSREGLNLSGEQTYRVPSLSLPEAGRVSDAAALMQCEAVQLFVERAGLACPDFAVTSQNAPALASLCARLDGIPLAIELAAARTRSLTIEEILARLNHAFRLLTGGSQNVLPRQQTLWAAIDWSYNLLSPMERMLLPRLSVFAGGWTLAAAEAVCADAETEAQPGRSVTLPPSEILDLLTALVDKSLVAAVMSEGKTRYRFLETVRQFATEKCESGREAELGQRHRAYFLTLTEAAEPHLTGPEMGVWQERLDAEIENLRAALVWGREEASEAQMRLHLNATLGPYWIARGFLYEGRYHLLDALQSPGAASPTTERRASLNFAGHLSLLLGDYAMARTLLTEALTVSEQTGDRRGSGVVRHNLGNIAWMQGDYETAQTDYEEALRICREQKNVPSDANALKALGQSEAVTLNGLGCLLSHQGKFDGARDYFLQSLALARQASDCNGETHTLLSLADLSLQQEALTDALSFGEQAQRAARQHSIRLLEPGIENLLGEVKRRLGDWAAADALFRRALTGAQQQQETAQALLILENMAALRGQQGETRAAGRLYGFAARERARMASPLPPSELPTYERNVAAARAGIADDAWNALQREGEALTWDAIIAEALAKVSPSPPAALQ